MTETVSDNAGAISDDRALRETIRQRVEAAGTSFYWAMRMLPQDRRNGMYAVYAFCREVDDIADDDARPPDDKKNALAEWHGEIDAIYAGCPRHLVARALSEPVMRYALRQEDFHTVIDGMEMDAAQDIRAPDLATLDLYCASVASAVGHLSVHIFGDSGPAAHEVADALGRALQLTNILRDIDEDAAIGRLYLPKEGLAQAGITSSDPLAVAADPALPKVCASLVAMATDHFAKSDAIMARNSRRAVRAPRIMSKYYGAILQLLVARGFANPRAPVRVNKIAKLAILLRYGFF
jgi:phytoene synthase